MSVNAFFKNSRIKQYLKDGRALRVETVVNWPTDLTVRMVTTLRAELGTEHGTVQRVASQLGCGTESVRSWVRQADIDEGHVPGVSTSDAARVMALEQENRELKRANEILKRAACFFGAELHRQHRK